MKRLMAVLGVCTVMGCGTRYYSKDEAFMMTQSSAKETCSCIFILGLDEARCADYSRLIGPRQVVSLTVNREENTVEGRLLGYLARARWVNPEQGCVMEP